MGLFTRTKKQTKTCNVTRITADVRDFYLDNSKAVNTDGYQNRLAAITRFSIKHGVTQAQLKELFDELHTIAGNNR